MESLSVILKMKLGASKNVILKGFKCKFHKGQSINNNAVYPAFIFKYLSLLNSPRKTLYHHHALFIKVSKSNEIMLGSLGLTDIFD